MITISRDLIKEDLANHEEYRVAIFAAISTKVLRHRSQLLGGQLQDLVEHSRALQRIERGEVPEEIVVDDDEKLGCSGSFGQPTRDRICKGIAIVDGMEEVLENNWEPVPWRKH